MVFFKLNVKECFNEVWDEKTKFDKKYQSKNNRKTKKKSKSKFSNKYSERIKSIRESDEKFKQNHKSKWRKESWKWDSLKRV